MNKTCLLPALLVIVAGRVPALEAPVSALSSAPDSTSKKELPVREEIVVTATRSPYSLARAPVSLRVISADTIAQSGASSVEQLLRGEGTLQVRDSLGNGRDVRIAIRGLTAGQNALILVDGRKINNSDLSEPDLTAISLVDVERIEILEGGAGVLFGDQAVGGVVNIITVEGKRQGGLARAGYGSYDTRDLQLTYTGRVVDNLDYRFSAQGQKANGYRDLAEVDYRHFRGDLGYRYGGGNRIYLEMQKSDNEYLLPGALLAGEMAADRRQAGNSYNDYNMATETVRLGLNQRLGGDNQLLVAYTDRDQSVDVEGRSLTFGDSVTAQSRRVQTWDPRLVVNAGPARLTLGADIEDFDYNLAVNSAFGLSASEHRHRRRSEYAQVILAATESLQLSAGYRHAALDVNVDGGYFETDYDDSLEVRQLGFSWQFRNGFRLYGNRDETFRFPLPDENVDFLGHVVALEPQRGVALELGGQWRGSSVGVNIALFRHAIEDEIGYDAESFSNVNFDDSLRRGGTLDIDWQPDSQWQTRLSLSRFSAEFVSGELKGNRLPGVSEQLAKLVVNYTPVAVVNLYGEMVYTGSTLVDMVDNSPVIGGYSVFNLAASYSWRQWVARIRFNNITGKTYSELTTFFGVQAYYPSPRLNAALSLEYRFE